MDRRRFISLTAAATASITHTAGSEAPSKPSLARKAVLVRAGLSRHPDGTEGPLQPQQTIVRSIDSEGKLAAFVIPVSHRQPFRGAPLHVHHEIDEWLYILDGEFVAEVGGTRYRLKAGDSLLMPMRVPHRWSNADSATSGVIHLYTPAGKMDVSWDPTPDDDKPQSVEERKATFESFGMTLLGNPLTKEEIQQTA